MQRTYRLLNHQLVACNREEAQFFIFVSPDEEERHHLVHDLKVDEHTLASALDPDELARLEFEPEHLALIYKLPRNYSAADMLLFKVTSVGLFVFREKLVLVAPEDTVFFEGKQFQRIHSVEELALRLIYRSVFHFLEHLKIINQIADSLESKVSAALENKYLLNLFTLEKSLVYYVNAINSNMAMIERLRANAPKANLSPENIELLDDLLIENKQCFRQAEIQSNVLASLMDARASIVGNNLNRLMKTLNLITIAIMIPTLVVSIFSMNVELPVKDLPFAFWLILGISGALAMGAFLVWRKLRL
jgi:magnesium transporter